MHALIELVQRPTGRTFLHTQLAQVLLEVLVKTFLKNFYIFPLILAFFSEHSEIELHWFPI